MIFACRDNSTYGMKFEFDVGSYSYFTNQEIESDNIKIYHYIKSDLTGEVYNVDHSPYSYMNKTDVSDMITMIELMRNFDLNNSQESEFDYA